VLTAGLVASGAELCSPVSSGVGAVLWLGILVAAGFVALGNERNIAETSALDLTVGSVAIGIWIISVGAELLYGLGELWTESLQFGLYAVVYIVLRRCLVGLSSSERRWLLAPTVASMSVVCLVGSVSVGAVLHEFSRAQEAEISGQHVVAASRYRLTEEQAQNHGFVTLAERSKLGLTRSLLRQGKLDVAKNVMGIPADGVITIEPTRWKGPTGVLLFKNVSCWEDVWLLEGKVDVEISVIGPEVRGVVPLLRVELGGDVLGEIEVTSAGGTTHTLSTQVATGRQRLELRLMNGFWTSGGEHRWARLGTAQIRYRE